MVNSQLHINSTLGDLELKNASICLTDNVLTAYSLFEKDKTTPGLILLKDGRFYGMLSKSRFFEIMSHQFMYDLYSKRKISHFFEEDNSQPYLILDSFTTVIDATNEALNRREPDIFEPVIVRCVSDEYRLLDFYQLLVAQNKIQLIMNGLLKQANEFKKEVLAIVAHDLRNPISAILGFSELILEIDEITQAKELMRHISRMAFQMDDLVKSFLVSTINDSMELDLELSSFNLSELMIPVIKSFEYAAEKKGQKIIFETVYYPVNIYSDKLKIKEVVENLLSNAIKYSPENKEISLSLQVIQSFGVISVKDQGPGFTETDLKKVFGKFQRLSARPTGDESSTGLGLYIAKKIVDKLNGSLNLQSEQGKGATFTVSFPLPVELKADELTCDMAVDQG